MKFILDTVKGFCDEISFWGLLEIYQPWHFACVNGVP